MAEIAKKYPMAHDGKTKYDIKASISSLGPNAVLAPSGQDRVDAFTAYALMTVEEPGLTPDAFLAMADAALPGAKALMAAHLKSGMSVAMGRYGMVGDKTKIEALKAAVQKLPEYASAAGPAPKPATKG